MSSAPVEGGGTAIGHVQVFPPLRYLAILCHQEFEPINCSHTTPKSANQRQSFLTWLLNKWTARFGLGL